MYSTMFSNGIARQKYKDVWKLNVVHNLHIKKKSFCHRNITHAILLTILQKFMHNEVRSLIM